MEEKIQSNQVRTLLCNGEFTCTKPLMINVFYLICRKSSIQRGEGGGGGGGGGWGGGGGAGQV